jgi:GAF domain-containing protein/HAMP domain-containing protein
VTTERLETRQERWLQQRGGESIYILQSLEQVKSFVLAIIGIIYILFIAGFNIIQTQQLIVSMLVFTILYNLLLMVFLRMASGSARMLLNQRVRRMPLPVGMGENELERKAWQEIITLPWRLLIASLASAYFIVVLPVVLFMIQAGGATPRQVVYVTIGGVISTTLFAIQNTFALDQNLEPSRQVLVPRGLPKQKTTVSGLSIRTRIQIVVAVLIISAVALLVPIGYQALVNISAAAVSPDPIRLYLVNAAVVLLILVLFGVISSEMLSKPFTGAIDELSRTMSEVGSGNLNVQAKILSSDEMLGLTITLNTMVKQLQESSAGLMLQIEEGAAELNRRTGELQAAAQVAREAASHQDLNQLLERTVNMISSRFGFYHTGIFLLNETRDYAILRAASSDGGKKMLEKGHRLAVGQQGIVGAAAYQNRPRVVMDVGADAVYFNNPDLPLTRAEAAFPLAVRNDVIGILDIQSTSSDVFSQSDVDLLQTVADQVALAIQNTRLQEENRTFAHQQEVSNIEAVRRTWADRGRNQKRDYRYSPGGVKAIKSGGKPAEMGNRINIPINLRGQRIGNISLSRASDSIWSEEDRSLAIEVADQVGLALENARLLDEAQRRAAQEQAISELTGRLGRSVDPDSLLQAAIRELHMLPNVEEVSVYIGTGDENTSSSGKERRGE